MGNSETFLDRLILWFKNNKFFAVIIFLSIIIVAAGNVINSLSSISEKGMTFFSHKSDTTNQSPALNDKKSGPVFATEILKFGNKGTGPGAFLQGWLIAVDPGGNIYIGDNRQGGRIQLIDSNGKYISEWTAPNKDYMLLAIAADRKGNIYASNSNIYKYVGKTGKLTAKIDIFPGDIKIQTDGTLVAAIDKDLRFYAANGKLIRTVHNAILNHPDNDDKEDNSEPASTCDHIALDGEGNIYVMTQYGHSVFKFSPDGVFINRFGSFGTGVGQLRLARCLAVDSKGRVYVGDQNAGILVFGTDGHYITTFDIDNADGVANGMIFNDKNELLVASDDRVIKYRINDYQ